MAVDNSGNVYAADPSNNAVKEIPTSCFTRADNADCVRTLGGTFFQLTAVAVDGSGNVYVSDYGDSAVKEIPASCIAGANNADCVLTLGGGFAVPGGVAVDNSGNVYVTDTLNHAVKEIPASCIAGANNADCVLTLGGGFSALRGLAVDGSGNVYVVDYGNFALKEIPAGCKAASCVLALGGGLTYGVGVAVDGSGNVFVADSLDSVMKEIPASCIVGANDLSCTVTWDGGFSEPSAVAVDNRGNRYVADYDNNRIVEQQAQVDFGSVNVCPAGQTTPTPCNNTLTLTYYYDANTTIGRVKVLTTGIPGLDFQTQANDRSTTLCSANTFAYATTCTVDITFAPLAPGVRVGAVQIFDNSITPRLLAQTLIYGIGNGPAIAFDPGIQTTVPAGLLGLIEPYGVAVNAAGYVFIADYDNNQVYEVTPGGAQYSVPATGLSAPAAVAVDGAGDVFIADSGNSQVLEVTPTDVQTTVGSGLSSPYGVALDSAGDVFIADSGNNRVVEVTPTGVQTAVPATGLNDPNGVAVDSAGDIFIADSGNSRAVKVTPGGVQSTVPATGLIYPNGMAVDAAGDVFIADYSNHKVVEVTPSGVQTTIPANGLSDPFGVAVDAAGDVFIADSLNSRVVEINRSQPPSLSFANTFVESISTDSPKSFQFQNIGNQPLSGTGMLSDATDFIQILGTSSLQDCSISTLSLDPGAECNISLNFSPQSPGPLSATLMLTDNALNANAAPQDTQSIALSGTGFGVVVPNLVGDTQLAATTAIDSAGLTYRVLTGSSLTVPIGIVIGQSPTGGTAAPSASLVNLFVSTGTKIPNVVGDTQSAATAAITTDGLIVGTVTTQSSPTVAPGRVISQSPTAAPSAPVGSAVNVVVSTGPQVPNVVGDTQAAATTAITAAGLVLGRVTTQSSPTVPSGNVISENPAGGTSVNARSHVDLVVSIALSPAVQLSAASIQFGAVAFPVTETLPLMITNVGGGTLTVTPSINGPSYTISSSTCAAGVTFGNSCTLQVRFAPVQVGLHNDVLTIANNGSTTPTVNLLGKSTGISVSTQGLSFSSAGLYLAFGTISATTSESLPLTITNSGVPGTVALNFSINGPSYTIPAATNGCLAGISSGHSCQLTLLYKPIGTGLHNDTLTITPSAGASPSTIGLFGSAN